MNELAQYEKWMNQALNLARRAFAEDEVPVGALVLHEDKIIAEAYNKREQDRDPLAHAEIRAIAAAAEHLGRWRLQDCTMVVTLEPCAMCAGALVNARIQRLIFAASDPKAGACGSVFNIAHHPQLNHRVDIIPDVLASESRQLLQDFFRNKRA